MSKLYALEALHVRIVAEARAAASLSEGTSLALLSVLRPCDTYFGHYDARLVAHEGALREALYVLRASPEYRRGRHYADGIAEALERAKASPRPCAAS